MQHGFLTRSMTILTLIGIGGLPGCGSSSNEYVAPPPPEVTVARPVTQQITPFVEQTGVVEAVEEAEVRARVRGFVESIEFKPGDEVQADDVLYRIEANQYQAAVNAAAAAVKAADAGKAVAEAMVKVAAAEEKNAAQQLAREQELMEKNAGSPAALDAAVAARDRAAASLESAEAEVEAAVAQQGEAAAALEQAELELNYTTVRAPIDGRISPTDIKLGNLVEDGQPLARIVDRREVFVNFSISDREMLEFMQQRRDALQSEEPPLPLDWGDLQVFLSREVDRGFPFTGQLDYVDQQGVDRATGTIRLRSKHANADGQLFPGIFVRIRLPIPTPIDATLLPEQAILREQRGKFVLAIDNENKVQRLPVTAGETISGWTIVKDGLAGDARVVVNGLQRARPGLEVSPVETTLRVDQETLLRGLPAPQQPAASAPDPSDQDSSE